MSIAASRCASPAAVPPENFWEVVSDSSTSVLRHGQGMKIAKTLRRYRSSRNVPARQRVEILVRRCDQPHVARIVSCAEPSNRAPAARAALHCVTGFRSPISSRNSVPPAASSNRPSWPWRR
jgi:hypothetical protein